MPRTVKKPKIKLEQPLEEVNLKELCRQIRTEAGLTQAELAKYLTVSKRSVESWESNKEKIEPGGQAVAKLYELKLKVEENSSPINPS